VSVVELLEVKLKGSYIGKLFLALKAITDVWLLPRMYSHMSFQGAPLNKTLFAILDSAGVWSLVGVDAVMSPEVCFAGKGLVAVSMDKTRQEILYHLATILP
jgi:hypothetical protein